MSNSAQTYGILLSKFSPHHRLAGSRRSRRLLGTSSVGSIVGYKLGALAKKLNGRRGKTDVGMKSQSRNRESRRKSGMQ
jgi:hypothetical protein